MTLALSYERSTTAKIELDFRNKVELRGNKAASLEITGDDGTPRGLLRIGRAGIDYFEHRPGRPTPVRKSWDQIIEFLSRQ
jgi:hypothetical protein